MQGTLCWYLHNNLNIFKISTRIREISVSTVGPINLWNRKPHFRIHCLFWCYHKTKIYQFSQLYSSSNVCYYVPCLNDALPAGVLNSMSSNSWFLSVFFFNLPSEEELLLNFSSIMCYCMFMMDSALAPYRFSFGECRLSYSFVFSKSFKIFQNLQTLSYRHSIFS